jgi:hypothetical protein
VGAPRPENQRDTRRRFEQWAENPRCEANTISAVHNIKMVKVAERAGVAPSFGASPFALTRGNNFEASLLDEGAERLLAELVRTKVLLAGADGLCDLRIKANRGSDPTLQTLDEAAFRTMDILRLIGRARGAAEVAALPAVIAGATVKLPGGVMLPEALLIVDVLAVGVDSLGERAVIRVGEVKTYPDRGGFTSGAQLAQARAQLGVYLHALRVVTDSLPDAERPVFADDGFLVLTRPGSNFARVRAGEDLRYQAARAARGFGLLSVAAGGLPADVLGEPDDGPARLDAVLHAEIHYSEACLSFCDLEPRCHQLTIQRGDAVVLGDEMRRFVGGIGLDRVGELLDGAIPADDTERDFVERVRAAEDPGWD